MAQRWRKRPILAVALRLAIFFVPVGGAVVVARGVLRAIPAVGGPAVTARLTLALIVSLLVVDLLERVMKRLLPLSGLLRLSMVFPDRAPSRFNVARRSASIRDLDARLADAKARGIADEPCLAAEEILALVSALSSHDRRTRGHSERVRVFTDLLSAELGLNRSDRDHLRWAALLHDIGKLRVDPELLNKTGKPSEEEWNALRAHPSIGAAIIGPLGPWLGEWAHAVAHHHERFDGNGYPDGLAGDEVPYAGRIVSITDAFETMTAVRAYKRPMTAAAARSELVRDAGSHFDPLLVRAFLGISVWRLRWAMGPASWLAQLPLIGEIPKVGPAVAKVGDAAITGAKVVAASAALAASGLALSPVSAKPTSGSGAGVVAAPRDAAWFFPMASGQDGDPESDGPAGEPGRPGAPGSQDPGTSPSDPGVPEPGLTTPLPSDPLDPYTDPLDPSTDPLPSDPLPTDPLPDDPLPNGHVPPAIDELKKGLTSAVERGASPATTSGIEGLNAL